MTPAQVALVRRTWAQVQPLGAAVGALFYERLFGLDPTLRAMFPASMAAQHGKLVAMLGTAVSGLDRPAELLAAVRALGARHSGYGVRDDHYATVGTALLDTLERGLGAAFDRDARAAWSAAYGVLALTMREGAAAGLAKHTAP
jgi:hemoglobin-like flavoprotein